MEFALVLGLGLALELLTEPEPPLDDDPLEDPELEEPELGVMAASVGETTLAWPAKLHAVLAFFWFV